MCKTLTHTWNVMHLVLIYAFVKAWVSLTFLNSISFTHQYRLRFLLTSINKSSKPFSKCQISGIMWHLGCIWEVPSLNIIWSWLFCVGFLSSSMQIPKQYLLHKGLFLCPHKCKNSTFKKGYHHYLREVVTVLEPHQIPLCQRTMDNASVNIWSHITYTYSAVSLPLVSACVLVFILFSLPS